MSVKAWITITQDQFDQYRCEWPDDMPARKRKSYWVRFHFNDGAWIHKHLTQQEALAEAEESIFEGYEGQLVICGVEFSDKTCIEAMNCLNTGDSMVTWGYYGICKEYTWVPHKLPA